MRKKNITKETSERDRVGSFFSFVIFMGSCVLCVTVKHPYGERGKRSQPYTKTTTAITHTKY